MPFFAPTNTVAVKFWLCIHGYMAFWFSLLQNRKVLSNYLRRISSHLQNNCCSARGLKITKTVLWDKCSKNTYLSCFLAKGTRLEALFRFSVMWHLTREIQGSRVTSHNRSFDRYFPFLHWLRLTFIYLNISCMFCSFFLRWEKYSVQRKKVSKRKIFNFLALLPSQSTLCAWCTFLCEGNFCKNNKSFIYEE